MIAYQLKGGEEWRDGKLYGWTGRDCPKCHGTGERLAVDCTLRQCRSCGATGEEWGLMPEQPS